MKKLFIDNYYDGFNVEQIDCRNLSIACATGYYNVENYYYYCFLYAMKRWCNENDDYIVDAILKKMGLRIRKKSISSEEELEYKIIHTLRLNKPILVEIKYNVVFFNSLYKTKDEKSHLFLIAGYDETKGVVILKDYLMCRQAIKEILSRNVDAFIDFPITIEELKKMWKESKNQGVNNLFVLDMIHEGEISNYRNLFEAFNCDNKISNELELDADDIRKRYYNSIYMMMEIVRKAINNSSIKYNIKEEIEKEIDSILKTRNRIIYKIMKLRMKSECVNKKTFEELQDNDNNILEVIKKSSQMITNENYGKVNVALNAKVFCDSEKNNALASYAVNGIWDDEFNCWMSSYEYPEHWLMIDLGEVKNVNKVIVRHHPRKRILITCDYTIEGSIDEVDWVKLVEINNNEKNVNILDFKPMDIRYFRINIKKPNKRNSNEARIFSFEVY